MVKILKWLKEVSKFFPKQRLYIKQRPLPQGKPEASFLNAHDIRVEDNFSWIRENNLKSRTYINEENRFSESYFNKHNKKIKNVCKTLISFYGKQESSLPKATHGSFCYEYKNVFGKDNPVLIRKQDNIIQIVADPNVWSRETDYCSIGELRISPNEEFIAIAVDTEGHGTYDCWIVSPFSHKNTPKVIEKISNVSSFEWLDNSQILLVENDVTTNRNNKLYTYFLNQQSKVLLIEEQDEKFTMHVSKSRSNKFVFLCSHSKTTCELAIVDSFGGLTKIWDREKDKETYIDHMNGKFYALSLDDDSEFCVLQRDEDLNNKNEWQDFVTRKGEKNFILDMTLMKNKMIITENENLIPQLSIYNDYDVVEKTTLKPMSTPGVIEIEDSGQDTDKSLHISCTSPILPLTRFTYHSNTGTIEKISSTVNSWRSDDFAYEQVEVLGEDGITNIPVSLFYKKDVVKSTAPMFCHIYGSYGVVPSLYFSHTRACLLSKGWILMLPHVRGGQERGRRWHTEGKLRQKINTFQDLRSCLVTMHDRGISLPERTALYGKSSGGLPIAWLLNQQAGMHCKACIMQAPFISVLHTMLLKGEQLTSQEYLEWGNPRENKDDFNYIQSYCPYHNIKVYQDDPAILVRTSISDNHVPYWIALQWVAKRRHLLAGFDGVESTRDILCHVSKHGGHFGYTFDQNMQEDAEMITFLESQIQ